MIRKSPESQTIRSGRTFDQIPVDMFNEAPRGGRGGRTNNSYPDFTKENS